MPTIGLASETDGPSILKLAAAANLFTPAECSCVEELWNAYQSAGEASGYVFLVRRDWG